MPYRPGKRRLMSEINVVPYIDVMLVLLIIFMVTAPLITQGVKVDLPQTVAEPIPPSDNEPVVVNIDAAGNYYINYGENQDQPVAAETLINRIAALLKYQPGIPVLVGGDKDVPYGQVVRLMSTLQSAGVPSVGLMTVPEGT
jgi:biopolymer transport protein TolR